MQTAPGDVGTRGTAPDAGTDRPAAGLRLAPGPSTEPLVWWERRCPSCGRSFGRTVTTCPADETPLKRVEVSLPFLWIG
ncbi:MAG: hypothetical protein ACRDJO_08555 [Actinomycetota bacterium]